MESRTESRDETTRQDATAEQIETTETTRRARFYWNYLTDDDEQERWEQEEERFKNLPYEKQMKIAVDSLNWIGLDRLKALNEFYRRLIAKEKRWEQFNEPPTEEEAKKNPVKIITPFDFIRVVIERGLEAFNDEYCKRGIYCTHSKEAREISKEKARKRFWEKRLDGVSKDGRRLTWFNFPTHCAGWYNW